MLLESYLSAAGRISALAVGDPKTPPMGEVYRVRQDASQSRHVEGLPLGTVGGFVDPTATLPLDGEYQFQVKLFRTNLGTMRGLEFPHQLEISVDGQRVHLAAFGGDKDVTASSDNPTTTGDEIDERFTVRVPLKAGPRDSRWRSSRRRTATIRAACSPTFAAPRTRSTSRAIPTSISSSITGPFNPTGVGDTPSRRAIFVCRPARGRRGAPCARRILSTLARRAYRGRSSPTRDLQRAVDFYQRGPAADRHASMPASTWRCAACWPARSSCFRVERDPAGVAPGTSTASATSSSRRGCRSSSGAASPTTSCSTSPPSGQLKEPAVLEQQVRRMLADPRPQALVSNFAGQWLLPAQPAEQVPNSFQFPDFDDDLRQALVRETELFFESVMRRGPQRPRSADGRLHFVNERLAKHYGMPDVYGSQFRRVTLTDDARAGCWARARS